MKKETYQQFLINEAERDARRLERAYFKDGVGIDALTEYQKGLGDNFELVGAYLEGLSPMMRQLMRILRSDDGENE